MKDKLKAAIYGLAVGDALGVPFEFKKRGSFSVNDMIGYGTHNQPIGTWSDDTSMTLALCDSLKVNNKRVNIYDIKKRFRYWLYQGKYTSNGSVFDCGNTTYQAIKNRKGINDINANGNGSLMRILPLAFCDVDNNEIDEVSAITHGHDISKEACRIYIKIAKQLLQGNNLSEILNCMNVSEYFKRLKYMDDISEDNIFSTGYVIHTLEASMWCLLKTNKYEEAVLKAVSLGDDTDTTAAVTGGLAGIIYGYEGIPKKWIEKIKINKIDRYLFM